MKEKERKHYLALVPLSVILQILFICKKSEIIRYSSCVTLNSESTKPHSKIDSNVF